MAGLLRKDSDSLDNMTKKTIERLVRDTETARKFHLLYERCIGLTKSCADAYNLAERIHKKRHDDKPFYKNYVSFRTARKHYLRNIKK